MKNLERMINRHPQLIELADYLLPEFFRAFLRRLILGEKFPLAEPFEISVNSTSAQFWINNPSDWYRIAHSGFEEGFIQELLTSILPSDIFLDIDSAQGLYAILAAAIGAEVYAIEPDPISIASLRKNQALNVELAKNLHILDMAVGDWTGNLELNIDPNSVQAASFKRVSPVLSKRVLVPITTVDILITSQQIKSPTVVKIDVEGAEYMVLKGMRELLVSNNHPDHLFIELHKRFWREFDTSLEEIQAYVTEVGYIPVDSNHTHRNKQFRHFVPAK